jgi:CrcB protein
LKEALISAVLVGTGGFTTYSTFSYETFAMIRGSEYLRAAGNVGLHVVLGLALVWAGYVLVTRQV